MLVGMYTNVRKGPTRPSNLVFDKAVMNVIEESLAGTGIMLVVLNTE